MRIDRLLEKDYLDYLNLINQLTTVGDISQQQFSEFVNNQSDNSYVLTISKDNKIVGCATILIEQKIAHSYSCVMHIEDVVTDINYRGFGIASQIFKHIINIAKEKCYKIILNCSDENINFYKKLGFEVSQTQMRYNIK